MNMNCRKHYLILLALSLFISLIGCTRQQEEEKAYREVLMSAGEVITKMASACISHARSYINVREYARVTGEDFDTIKDKILGKEFQELQAQLKANKVKIDEFMEGLEEPPSPLSEMYEKLFELHALYSKIHTLAVSPSGSMDEYSDLINDLESQMKDLKSRLDWLYAQ
jgi:DNA repair ATPase RecN